MTFRSAASTFQASTTTIIATAPAGYQAGDVLVAIYTSDGTGQTLGFPAGWTLVRQDTITNGDQQTAAWGWIVATGSDSFTFTGGSALNAGVSIAAYFGGKTSPSPIETSSANNPNSASVPSSPVSVIGLSVSTSAPDDIVMLGCVDTNGNNGTWTSSGLTVRTQTVETNTFAAVAIGDFTQTGPGSTGNQTMTWTESGAVGNFIAYLIALAGIASPTATIAWVS